MRVMQCGGALGRVGCRIGRLLHRRKRRAKHLRGETRRDLWRASHDIDRGRAHPHELVKRPRRIADRYPQYKANIQGSD